MTMMFRPLRSRTLAVLMSTALATAPLLPDAGVAQTASAGADAGIAVMSVGSSRVLNVSGPISDVIIANPNVLDVHVRSTNQLYLIAKAPGESNVTVTRKDGSILYSTRVRVGNNLTSIDQMVRMALPDANIQSSTLNGMVMLTGTIAAPEDAAEAERLVQALVGKDVTVVGRLKTATPLQVNLQVRIAEVNKSMLKSIGFNILTSFNNLNSNFIFGLGQGSPGTITYPQVINPATGTAFPDPNNGGAALTSTLYTMAGPPPDTTRLNFGGGLLGGNILTALDLAETRGLVSTLANPNLTALSGETASFLAGGEIPIPISTTLGQVSIEWKPYGVSLAFTPTVLADGRISMRVRPEVSQLDDNTALRLNNFTVPGILTRRAETTVELGSGQSFMIGGLLSNTNGNSVQKAPFLGDLPILGNLFKSTRFQRKETELVILVTPYLVRPMESRAATMPVDGYRTPTDAQRLLGGQFHSGKSNQRSPKPVLAPPRTVPAALPARPSLSYPGTSGAQSGSAPVAPARPGGTRANKANPGFSF
jgi:pilus assembly protein CpaC